jgi:type VI secretion system protein ImpF
VARKQNEVVPQLSILDRLLDDDPGATYLEPPAAPYQVLRQLKLAVRRDLEDLLNTRLRPQDLPLHLQEVRRSLFCYGLPDFASVPLSTARDREGLCTLIRGVILQFEPRLRNVQVMPATGAEPLDRTFRFRIEALLRIEPAPEPVTFDSRIEPSTGDVKIEGGGQ